VKSLKKNRSVSRPSNRKAIIERDREERRGQEESSNPRRGDGSSSVTLAALACSHRNEKTHENAREHVIMHVTIPD
jgi:hypothetical protein